MNGDVFVFHITIKAHRSDNDLTVQCLQIGVFAPVGLYFFEGGLVKVKLFYIIHNIICVDISEKDCYG